MAEEKTLTLAQQYSLKEKEESAKRDEIPAEAIAVATPTNAAPSDVVDAAPANVVAQEVVENPTSAPAEETVTESLTTPTSEEVVPEKTEEAATAVESSEAPEEEKADEETAEETPEIKLETAPADFRFPTTNQSRHCFTRYIEYHRCIAAKGDDAPECNKFAKYYRALCPGEWVDRWNEQRENGTFPGPL